MNQVFEQADYADFILGLQKAQALGNGAIHRATLTTVENLWWGVVGGQGVDLTVVYASRCPTWEAQLPPAMQKLVRIFVVVLIA
jgi:hypothetical protein